MSTFITHETSLIGERPKNEDELVAIKNSDNNNNLLKPYNLYSIFDGHGGSKVSKYLKEKLPPFFINKMVDFDPSTHNSCNKQIFKTYDFLQNKLKSFELPSKICGSTALIIMQYADKKDIFSKLKIVNLGDCRAVICDENNIGIPLTKDHKPMSWDENKRILKLNGIIEVKPNDDPRINGLSVSRAFGDLDAKPHVSHEPDIYDYQLTVSRNFIKEKFIIMACDGVWDVISNQEAVDFILYKLDVIQLTKDQYRPNSKNIANLLGEYALSKGSQDNISVLIIFL